jgi:hypothetical protein
MTGQKLIVVDNCRSCPFGSPNMYGTYCSDLKTQVAEGDDQKDTHPDCKLESARGFL